MATNPRTPELDPRQRIIVALDVAGVYEAVTLVDQLAPYVGGFKLGLEVITATYANLMTTPSETALLRLQELRTLFDRIKGKLFWDGKWMDIPNTVAGAARGIMPLAPLFINVHASAGYDAIKQVVANSGASKVLGVTVLTSIGLEDCVSIYHNDPKSQVLEFAMLLSEAGAHGIICSPQELQSLQTPDLNGLLRVIPGIRPVWAATGDQKRIMTPREAVLAGADYLVIGRPITKPPIGTPKEAAKRIAQEIQSAA